MSYQPPCPEWAEKLALRQEDLTPSERAELDAHIRTCPTCSATRSEYSKLITRLQTLTSPAMTQSVKLPVQNPSHIGSPAIPTNKRTQPPYSPWKGISNIGDKICQKCGLIGDANALYCGNCGYPLDGSKTGHPTASFQGLQQARITRILDNVLDDTLPTFTPQPLFQPRRNIIALTVLALMLISALLGIQLGKGSTQVTVSNTPITSNLSGTLPASNPTAASIPTPTPSPTPTPTPCPNPCVVYQENGSDNWANWSYPDGWRVVGKGLLLGTETSTLPAAVAPYLIPAGTLNFAIEAVIAIPQGVNQDHSLGFGITACGSSTPNGWQGYAGGITTGFLHLNGNIDEGAAVSGPNGQIGTGTFSPGGTFYTYRLEIKGNDLTLKINGAPVIVDAKDQNYLLCGSQVGIFDTAAANIQIQSFTVITL